MFNKKAAIAAAIAMTAIGAQAQSGLYTEVGYGAFKYSEPSISMTPTAARVIVGQDINDNLSIEGMAATGISDGNTTYSSVGIGLKINDAYGIYLKPKVKVADNVEVFARVGYTHLNGDATLTGSRGSLKLNMDGGDTSFGAGVKYSLSKTSYIVADYMSYYAKDGVTVKGYTIGMGFNF